MVRSEVTGLRPVDPENPVRVYYKEHALGIVVLALLVDSSGTAPVEEWKSRYDKLRQEFKDYIETSRRNEEIKRQELKIDSAKKLLVVADSLSRITAVYNPISCDIVKNYSENLKKNIDVIYGQLLSASGLTPIEPAAGDKFDDRMHTAIGLEYGTAYPENSVFRVIRKGYRIGDNVVRPAEVVISKRPVEVIKIKKPGLRDRILRWISPAKLRFAEVNQRMNEFERIQKEKVERLTQDITSLKDIITQLEARNKRVDELERVQKEKVERLTQDITSLKDIITQLEARNKRVDELERVQKEEIERLRRDIATLKNMIMELEAKNDKVNEFECMQEEKIEELTQDISSLRSMVIELEEKLKEQALLQSGYHEYQENAVFKNNQE
ncbi:MAG: nucleotide exchange factor GrpE [Methanophagales archaeon ANME-1-THS]|nr:MAG: nucleotide exchange factor GrpE [Methanophagales archaeon ANME-1-THS]